MNREILVPYRQPQVKQILDGTKTQTRRPLRNQPPEGSRLIYDALDCYQGEGYAFQYPKDLGGGLVSNAIFELPNKGKPRFQPGSIMCVRERARLIAKKWMFGQFMGKFKYEADGHETEWVPLPPRIKFIKQGHCVPNGCFKELVRIKRKVLRVWYERVQKIHALDIRAEGIKGISMGHRKEVFKRTLDSIYPDAWKNNIWMECTEFEGIKK